MNLKFFLLTLQLSFATQLSAAKLVSLLNKSTYEEMTAGKEKTIQEIAYFDAQDLPYFSHNITIKLHLKSEKADFTVKIRGSKNQGSVNTQPFSLEASDPKLAQDYEYICKFAKKEVARPYLTGAKKISELTIKECPLHDESTDEKHPLTVLKANLLGELSVVATMKTEHVEEKLKKDGATFKLSVEKNDYSGNLIGYEAEIKVPNLEDKSVEAQRNRELGEALFTAYLNKYHGSVREVSVPRSLIALAQAKNVQEVMSALIEKEILYQE